VTPLDLLPRRCPVCGNHTIVGHGRRLRHAHDDRHERIWVRRGICRPCRKTFTALPHWLAPSAPFSLHCRQQACEHIAAGDTAEQAAPHVKTRRTCPIYPPCADGHNGDWSACGAGSRPESETRTFWGHPPSSPGIRKLVGEETINSYLCDKYAFTYHDKSMGTQYQWISKKLKVMIKIDSKGSPFKMSSEYKNIKEESVPDSLFELPAGYTKISKPGLKK